MDQVYEQGIGCVGCGFFYPDCGLISCKYRGPTHDLRRCCLSDFPHGITCSNYSENLGSRLAGETPDIWAYVVHMVDAPTVTKELDAVYGRDAASRTDKVFLSAVSRTSVTVSGPPLKLKSLFNKSRFFRDSTSIPLPVYGGLCHAPHIFDTKDVQKIISESSLFSLATIPTPRSRCTLRVPEHHIQRRGLQLHSNLSSPSF